MKTRKGYLSRENKAALEQLLERGSEPKSETAYEAAQTLSFHGCEIYTSAQLNLAAVRTLKNAIARQGQ